MFYTSFTLSNREMHYKIRAKTMEEALQRVCDFSAGVGFGLGTAYSPQVTSMSVKPTRGIVYEEGF